MTSRRNFLEGAASSIALMLDSATLPQQTLDSARRTRRGADTSATPALDSSNLFAMDQMASRPVRMKPKPGARPSMSTDERDGLEHTLRCQCGCTLDVYTCRTTDFSCQVSPAMHRDIIALVNGGYTAAEIQNAFVGVYGERVLMSPRHEGFNLLGYLAPFGALSAGALIVAALIWRWGGRNMVTPAPGQPGRDSPLDASAEELAELDAAVREDV